MMKNIVLICLLYVITQTAFAQSDYSLRIQTPDEANGKKAFIYIKGNDKRKTLKKDSAIITNNQLSFSGYLSQPSSFANISVKVKNGTFQKSIIVDTGKNEMALKNLPPQNVNYGVLDLSTSSKSNEINEQLDSITRSYYDEFAKKDEKSGVMLLNTETSLIMNTEKMNFLKKYSNNYFSLIALYELSLYHRTANYVNLALTVFKTLNASIQSSSFGQLFYKEKEEYLTTLKSAVIGHPAPEFSITTLEGKLFNNRSLKGQNYLIAFSAVWCAPCQEQLPELKRLYEKYKDKGLQIVYFNEDDDIARWKLHVQENNLTWINVSERVPAKDTKIGSKFNVYAIPSYFVVNKQGVVIYNSIETGSDIKALAESLEKLYEEQK